MPILRWLSLCALLTGCAVDATGNQVRDTGGTVLGLAEVHDIAAGDGRINLGLPNIAVVRRRGQSLVDRYDETVVFAGGWVRYQILLYQRAFSGNASNIARVQNVVDGDWYRQQGFSRPVRDLKSVVNRYGVAQYAVFDSAQGRCALFSQYFWTANSWPTSPGDTELSGSFCQPPPSAATVEATLVSLIQNLRVGPGVNPQSAAAPVVPPEAPSAASTPAAS